MTQPKPNPERKMYRPAEVREIYGMPRSTLYKHIKNGRLTKIKVGDSTYIAAADLDRLFTPAE